MHEETLQASESDRDGVTILRLEGGLTRANSEALRTRLDALVECDARGVAIDFEAVDYVDSSALGACAAVAKRMGQGGARPFVVFGANRMVAKMWRLIGLESRIPLLDDEETAMTRLGETPRD